MQKQLASMRSTVRATGDKGNKDVIVLFDTGAECSFVTRKVAEELATLAKLPKPLKITLGDKSQTEIGDQACLHLAAAGEDIVDSFAVLDDSVADVILGEPTMRKYGLKIDMERNVIFCALKVAPNPKTKELPMWKKFLAGLGINVSKEEVTEEEAAALLKGELSSKAKGQEPKRPASPAVVAALKLADDATEDDELAAIMVLQQKVELTPVERMVELDTKNKEAEILAVVETACRPGQGEMEGKLFPRQKAWALEQARGNLDAFKKFVKDAPKVLAIMDRLAGQKEKAVVIDDDQARINAQLGVSEADFRKHNVH